ncbi:uncharacterized protein AMSG_04855 [Thecamonas trahens ATCC 50062]|uniref:Uncharacterized protein n=1 Tax=Thecamonas trahens ATCC 50062 TaxID=461836 RepID=A0A0L0D8J8_THETB|nr:hypothetical protein AMSG_04855 [Thecamonas trahens ATCC 50062]KNC48406.1 hypothetical protein AMSG_04855 [Thecamonas trahens ATCC 50062]|eukprot:XP_013758523.1 hypothetical protein AMSG_04855 [Thecamonas trahens ATCC 50062]
MTDRQDKVTRTNELLAYLQGPGERLGPAPCRPALFPGTSEGGRRHGKDDDNDCDSELDSDSVEVDLGFASSSVGDSSGDAGMSRCSSGHRVTFAADVDEYSASHRPMRRWESQAPAGSLMADAVPSPATLSAKYESRKNPAGLRRMAQSLPTLALDGDAYAPSAAGSDFAAFVYHPDRTPPVSSLPVLGREWRGAVADMLGHDHESVSQTIIDPLPDAWINSYLKQLAVHPPLPHMLPRRPPPTPKGVVQS